MRRTVRTVYTRRPVRPVRRWLAGMVVLLLLSAAGGLAGRDYPEPTDAVLARDYEAVERLLSSHQLDANTTIQGRPLFFFVLARYQTENAVLKQSEFRILRSLIQHDLDLDAKDPTSGDTPLCAAAAVRGFLCEQMIRRKVNVNAKGANGRSPLECAFFGADPGCGWTLLQAGADPNIRDAQGVPLLTVAVDYHWSDRVKALVDYHVNPELLDAAGRTALHHAAASRATGALADTDAEIIGTLLRGGADPDAQDRDGRTPLHTAAEAGNLGGVQALIGVTSNPYLKDIDGRTALAVAQVHKRQAVVAFLMQWAAERERANEPRRAPRALPPVAPEVAIAPEPPSRAWLWIGGCLVVWLGGSLLSRWRRRRRGAHEAAAEGGGGEDGGGGNG